MKKTLEEIITPIVTRYRVMGKLTAGGTPALVARSYRWARKTVGHELHKALSLALSNPAPFSYEKYELGKADERGYRWTDIRYGETGLRFVSYSDNIITLRHQGWFTSDDGIAGETYRGCVFQIAGRKGKARYLAGYHNTIGEEYIVDFSRVYMAPPRDGPIGDCNVLNMVARDADQMARIDAERECEHNRNYQDAARWDELFRELGEDAGIADLRRQRDDIQEQLDALEQLETIEARFPDVATFAKENL